MSRSAYAGTFCGAVKPTIKPMLNTGLPQLQGVGQRISLHLVQLDGQSAARWHAVPEPARRHGRRPWGYGTSGKLILVRNHEGDVWACAVHRRTRNDVLERRRWRDDEPAVADRGKGEWEAAWATLAGTVRNCAGGVTPWGTWITGEESGDSGARLAIRSRQPARRSGAALRHGTLFTPGQRSCWTQAPASSTRPKTTATRAASTSSCRSVAAT